MTSLLQETSHHTFTKAHNPTNEELKKSFALEVGALWAQIRALESVITNAFLQTTEPYVVNHEEAARAATRGEEKGSDEQQGEGLGHEAG